MLRKLLFAGSILVLAALFVSAHAQQYPTRAVTLVVGFAPGGPSDVVARVVSRKLEQVLGQPIVIDNRGGAGGNIAAEDVAGAGADGYTLLLGTNGILAANPSLYRKINYKPEDFAPISLIGVQPNVLLVNPSVAATTLPELITLAKGNPGKLNYGSGGHGTAAHLSGELFKSEAKVDIVHVAYKGTGPALQDVVAGHVHMMFSATSPVLSLIQEGKVRALAVTTSKRTAALPDVGTVSELALPGFDAATWHGLVAPAGTSVEVIGRLHRAVVTALDDREVKASLTKLGVDLVGNTPAEFDAYIKSEIPKWAAVIKASGARLD